jgi:hypothetical protein
VAGGYDAEDLIGKSSRTVIRNTAVPMRRDCEVSVVKCPPRMRNPSPGSENQAIERRISRRNGWDEIASSRHSSPK